MLAVVPISAPLLFYDKETTIIMHNTIRSTGSFFSLCSLFRLLFFDFPRDLLTL